MTAASIPARFGTAPAALDIALRDRSRDAFHHRIPRKTYMRESTFGSLESTLSGVTPSGRRVRVGRQLEPRMDNSIQDCHTGVIGE
jgi:hypothetical protein